MADKIVRQSPKIEIINYFDDLIKRVDIDIENCLEKYNEEQVLSQLHCFEIRKDDKRRMYSDAYSSLSERIKIYIPYKSADKWPESTKVVNYLNQVRMKTIEELRKAQEESIEYYKQNSSQFKSKELCQKKMDEIMSQVFKDKFYFQVFYNKDQDDIFRSSEWIFNLFTFVTDFYMSQTEIDLLEKLINLPPNHCHYKRSLNKQIFYKKIILIELVRKKFFKNLITKKFPSHVIRVRKRDLLEFQKIVCNYDAIEVNLTSESINLCNIWEIHIDVLERNQPLDIKIEGLSSLKCLRLECFSIKQITLRNLSKLTSLYLKIIEPVNSEIQSNLFDCLPNIEQLELDGNFSNVNLDNLVCLNSIKFNCTLMDDFNMDILKNISNQLEKIEILGSNLNDKFLAKLFYGRKFPFLIHFEIFDSKMTKIEKKLFDGFPMLQTLNISNHKDLRIIEFDAFSNVKNLDYLNLCYNCIDSIDIRLFSHLINLRSLILSGNRLESIEENLFSSLENLEYLDLDHNKLTTLDSKSFVGLKSLNCLNLADNRLEVIKDNWFSSLQNLEYLYLSNNQLKSLDPKSFVGLKNLKHLNLKKNNLANNDFEILDNIEQIKEIVLSENLNVKKEKILNHFVKSNIRFVF